MKQLSKTAICISIVINVFFILDTVRIHLRLYSNYPEVRYGIEKMWRNKYGEQMPYCKDSLILIKNDDKLTERFIQGEQYKGGIATINEKRCELSVIRESRKERIDSSGNNKTRTKASAGSMSALQSIGGYEGTGKGGRGTYDIGKVVPSCGYRHNIKGIVFLHAENNDNQKTKTFKIAGVIRNTDLRQLYVKKHENYYRKHPATFTLAVHNEKNKFPIVAKILFCPLTLSIDIVTSPFQLVFLSTGEYWMPK